MPVKWAEPGHGCVHPIKMDTGDLATSRAGTQHVGQPHDDIRARDMSSRERVYPEAGLGAGLGILVLLCNYTDAGRFFPQWVNWKGTCSILRQASKFQAAC